MTIQDIVIADVDGCCLDPKARLHFIDKDDWRGYEEAWQTDVAIPQGVIIYRALMNKYRLIYVTSRSENQRASTLIQLRHYVSPWIKNENLIMRPVGDMDSDGTPDHILKPKLVQQAGIALDRIFMVFEDRQSVVDTWRKLGVVVYQTAAGTD